MATNLETQKNYEKSAKNIHYELLNLKSEIREDEDKNLRENEELEEVNKKDPDKIIRYNKLNIESAAKEFGIDKYLLAAIIYYEQQRLILGENIVDTVLARGHTGTTTVGLGQIQVGRAILVEDKVGKITPKEKKQFLVDGEYQARINRLKDPKWNIRYLAAYLKYLQDKRKDKFPQIIDRPDILATAYHNEETEACPNPVASTYGKDVKNLIPHMKEELEWIEKIIKDNKSNIESTAKEFGVDKYLLAAIIYREQLHLKPGEDVRDVVFSRGHLKKVSVGSGQIQVKRAIEVEDKVGKITEEEKKQFLVDGEYQARINRLKDPKWNIRYVAAYLKYLQDKRKNKFPPIIDRPDILATVYNNGKTEAHSNPVPSDYGKEVNELIPDMKKLLDN